MQKKSQFQSIILALQHFWADKGCLIWQPYYTQVGAGTMNPATFLRVLGPEPWNVGYVEPSIRPDDGRYGDNPYRLQQHYQFQVILKPDPGNPQELYLQSLEAIGIDPHNHDIRFVEDNWESPALGAWGLGWEVWLDGQEITQFTYFQQAGGFNLEPVSVEITYGLERIAMALQGNYNFRDIQWTSDFTYGDVNLQGEQEHSRYYFEVAEISRLREMFDLFEKEANLALEQGLVLPAHDYILKCSHTFNILDTRGAVGVTERQALFGRMRDLSHRTAEAYITQRESLGFPWLDKPSLSGAESLELNSQAQLALPKTPATDTPSDLLIEIGCEELPVGDLKGALDQLRESVPSLLGELRLTHTGFRVMGTPRRLVIHVQALAPRQADITRLVKGPPADRAYDAQGKLTPAALGFARSKGIDEDKLQSQEMDGGTYLVAEVHEKGQSVFEVMPERISGLIGSLRFDKSMRWNASGAAFSRPIRWLTGLYGNQVLPFRFAGLASSRETRLLRFSDHDQIEVKHPADYFSAMKENGIVLGEDDRRETIENQVKALLATAKADRQVDEGLLDEVTNLVEAPTALMGNFDKAHLALPGEVLSGVMMKHQRYFPVPNEDGKLMAHFITVRNGGSQHLETVAHGNEEVIQARFADAAFFIKEDSDHQLADFIPRLDTLVFQPKLGSMLDKTHRITRLAETMAGLMHFDELDAASTSRAAKLCKADLVTSMVVEMTALQGIMGKYYALQSGEPEAVALAIEEHYLPRYARDRLPETKPGLAVGLADRMDSLVGLFSVGMAPTGTRDPFGLRRAAIGLLLILTRKGIDLDLDALIASAASLLPVTSTSADQQACQEFIVGRFENQLLEEGFRYDAVKAVLAEQGSNPAKALDGVKALSDWIAKEDWREILPAFARCVRITRDQKEIFPVEAQHLSLPEEKTLFQGIRQAQSVLDKERTIPVFLAQLVKMIPAINGFFDAVLVMDENIQVRQNRLGMLQELAGMASGLADFSCLEGF